jgi:hypothetical protein
MLTWIPIAANDAPSRLRKGRIPAASAAVVGSSVVFRFSYAFSVIATTVPFASEAEASAWVHANRLPDQ